MAFVATMQNANETKTGCPACDSLPAGQRRAAHALCHPRILDALADLRARDREAHAAHVRSSAVQGVTLGSR